MVDWIVSKIIFSGVRFRVNPNQRPKTHSFSRRCLVLNGNPKSLLRMPRENSPYHLPLRLREKPVAEHYRRAGLTLTLFVQK